VEVEVQQVIQLDQEMVDLLHLVQNYLQEPLEQVQTYLLTQDTQVMVE
jgi:hypothetical protein